MDDRREISKRWKRGDDVMGIAYELGISQATVYAELRRGRTGDLNTRTGRYGYDPDLGAKQYQENIKKRGNRTQRKEAAANG